MKKLKRKPTTPGEILRDEFLIPLNLTQKKFADHIAVDIKVINRLVNDRTSISPELALKFAASLGTTAEFWLTAQQVLDLYKAKIALSNSLPERIKKAA